MLKRLLALTLLIPSMALSQSAPLVFNNGRVTPMASTQAITNPVNTSTVTTSGAITANGTASFFSPSANIHRMQDRLFVGLATVNDGAFPNVTKDWLSTLETGWGNAQSYPMFSTFNALIGNTSSNGYAILGGAQTLNLGATGAAIGTQGHGVCNQASATANCWGFYGEAHRVVTGAGSAYGIEVDPVAHVASIVSNPIQQGNVVGAQIACGGQYTGFTQFACSNGIQFAANGSTFGSAINVLRGSVTGSNPAIQLPTGNGIAFYDAAGHLGGSINASFTTANTAALVFDNNGMAVQSSGNGSVIAYFFQNATGANYIYFTAGNAGSPPGLTASGSDTNVNLALAAKGTGVVALSSPVTLPSYTVSTLPTCNAGLKGGMAYVTDANAPTYNGALTGGSTTIVPVFCNGSAWSAH